jgi:energy-coupling factor transporter ATP-binding protein EcfA2
MTPTTQQRVTAPVELGVLSLRKNERGLLLGGTGSGKSTLADMLRRDFLHRYRLVGGRCLIVDTKPRYRAQWQVNGVTAARRYKRWDHGPAVTGSYVVDDVPDLKQAWKLGARVVIVQCESKRDLARVIAVAQAFLDDSRAGRPQLIQWDEVSDFFHTNGMAKGGDDTVERSAKAGRERGCANLYCSQRSKGISSSLLEHMTRGYFMVLDSQPDAKRVYEMGAPEFVWPTQDHVFMYWTKQDRHRVWGPYKLKL